jgi:hypothetical protein
VSASIIGTAESGVALFTLKSGILYGDIMKDNELVSKISAPPRRSFQRPFGYAILILIVI